jgi:hypothetical protein
MNIRAIIFVLALNLGIILHLTACDMANENRPQDKRMQLQEERLKMAIKQLEAEADRVVLEGKRLYGEASQHVQNFAGQSSQSLQDLSQVTGRIVEQAKSLQGLPMAVEAHSQKVMAAAQAAVGYAEPTALPSASVKTR